MNETELSPDVNKAKDMVAGIVKSIEAIDTWSSTEAEKKISALLDRWKELCAKTESAKSRIFYHKCEEILKECISLRNEIAAKNESFKNTVEDQLPVFSVLAGDNEAVKDLMGQVINQLWNEVERPGLLFLYDKSAELETSVLDMMKFAMTV